LKKRLWGRRFERKALRVGALRGALWAKGFERGGFEEELWREGFEERRKALKETLWRKNFEEKALKKQIFPKMCAKRKLQKALGKPLGPILRRPWGAAKSRETHNFEGFGGSLQAEVFVFFFQSVSTKIKEKTMWARETRFYEGFPKFVAKRTLHKALGKPLGPILRRPWGAATSRNIYIYIYIYFFFFPKVFAFFKRRKFAKLFKVSERKKNKKNDVSARNTFLRRFLLFLKLQKALRKPLGAILRYLEASRDGLEASWGGLGALLGESRFDQNRCRRNEEKTSF